MPQKNAISHPYTAALVLSSGDVFFGYGVGERGTAIGEVCFNTSLTGYQEIITDPSYTGQIITFTFPHIGNVGTNAEDMESAKACAEGIILRNAITPDSNFRSDMSLNQWLSAQRITAISGIDTRALTRLIRTQGAQNIAIYYPESLDKADLEPVKAALATHPLLEGLDLTKRVTTDKSYEWNETCWQLGRGFGESDGKGHHVVAIDYGEKYNILRLLANHGCRVTVVSADTSAADILALKPDGIFLSNGPGDPAATGQYALPIIRALIASGTPIFGICLGHQLLALAAGGETEKMFQGHRGANQPVQHSITRQIEITSQNHGFVVRHGSLPTNAEITHLSLFDGTIEGFRLTDKPVFAVQYHPESSPGPHDSRYLFRQFMELMNARTQ